ELGHVGSAENRAVGGVGKADAKGLVSLDEQVVDQGDGEAGGGLAVGEGKGLADSLVVLAGESSLIFGKDIDGDLADGPVRAEDGDGGGAAVFGGLENGLGKLEGTGGGQLGGR